MIRLRALLLSLLAIPAWAAQPDPAGNDPANSHLQDWSTKVYQFASSDLTEAFVSPERGQLRLPKFPKAGASDAELEAFIKDSTDLTTQFLKLQGIIVPKGTLLVLDTKTGTLAARTTNEVHAELAPLQEFFLEQRPIVLDFNVQLYEADAAVIRQAVKDASKQADHTPIMERLEKLADQGQARRLESLHLPTRSGQRATVGHLEKGTQIDEFTVDGRHNVSINDSEANTGTKIEIDPVLGPDGKTIDLNFSLDHNFAPRSERWEPILPGNPRNIEMRLSNSYLANTTTAITMLDGTSALCGVWKPEVEGAAPTNVWQAGFVHTAALRVMPRINNRALEILKSLGEKVEPQPPNPKPGEKIKPGSLPAGMILRRFRVPPTFLSSFASGGEGAAAGAPDPFAARPSAAPPVNEPRFTVRATAADILKQAGIEFPSGASANFNSLTSELIVRNTPHNVAQVEAFVASLASKAPQTIAIRLDIVQADAAFLRGATRKTSGTVDQSEAFKAIEQAADAGKAKILRTLWLETRSGQRASTRFGELYSRISEVSMKPGNLTLSTPSPNPAPPATPPNPNPNPGSAQAVAADKSTTLSLSEAIQSAVKTSDYVGTSLEVDPVLGSDGVTIDLNFALTYDYAPPTPHRPQAPADEKTFRPVMPSIDFHRANLVTSTAMLDGDTQFIGLWQPDGAPEFQNGNILQAAFLTAKVLYIGTSKSE